LAVIATEMDGFRHWVPLKPNMGIVAQRCIAATEVIYTLGINSRSDKADAEPTGDPAFC
jgi:hypothetical protein